MTQQTVGGMAASLDGLAATAKDCCGRDNAGGDRLLVDGTCQEDEHTYRLKVLGTGINTVLQFGSHLDTDAVAEHWLDGVSEQWNEQMAQAFADDIQVRAICQTGSTSSEGSQKATPMPPVPDETDSQTNKESGQ